MTYEHRPLFELAEKLATQLDGVDAYTAKAALTMALEAIELRQTATFASRMGVET